MHLLLLAFSVLAATADPVFLPTDAVLAREYAGSYELRRGHVIDIGVMDELGGDLVFLDQKTLRIGRLRAISRSEMVSGPTIAVDTPIAIRAEFVRNADGSVKGLFWTGEGVNRAFATRIAPRIDEEVEIRRGDVVLRGVLSRPAGKGPHPAVIFAHGSGPARRNVGYWNTYFVRLGFVVLSLDKRGAGTSTGEWEKASLDDIADDWLAGVDYLKRHPAVDAKRVGVHASSQGGWTAPIMASRSKDLAFMIVRAGSGVSLIDTMLHEIEWTLREAKFSEQDVRSGRAAASEAFALAARGASWAEFSAAVDPHRKQKWSEAVWPLQMSEAGWGRPWVQLNAKYDPAGPLRKVRIPVLYYFADNDHNVPTKESAVRVASALRAAGNKNVSIITIRKSGHGFLETPTGNNSDFATVTKMPAGYWDTMASWLRKNRMIGKR